MAAVSPARARERAVENASEKESFNRKTVAENALREGASRSVSRARSAKAADRRLEKALEGFAPECLEYLKKNLGVDLAAGDLSVADVYNLRRGHMVSPVRVTVSPVIYDRRLSRTVTAEPVSALVSMKVTFPFDRETKRMMAPDKDHKIFVQTVPVRPLVLKGAQSLSADGPSVEGVVFSESSGTSAEQVKENAVADGVDFTLALSFDGFDAEPVKGAVKAAGDSCIMVDVPESGPKHPDSLVDCSEKAVAKAVAQIKEQLPDECFSDGEQVGLNITGSVRPDAQGELDAFITFVLKGLADFGMDISLVRSGGREGVELAAASAARALGIPCEVHAAKGWEFKFGEFGEEAFMERFRHADIAGLRKLAGLEPPSGKQLDSVSGEIKFTDLQISSLEGVGLRSDRFFGGRGALSTEERARLAAGFPVEVEGELRTADGIYIRTYGEVTLTKEGPAVFDSVVMRQTSDGKEIPALASVPESEIAGRFSDDFQMDILDAAHLGNVDFDLFRRNAEGAVMRLPDGSPILNEAGRNLLEYGSSMGPVKGWIHKPDGSFKGTANYHLTAVGGSVFAEAMTEKPVLDEHLKPIKKKVWNARTKKNYEVAVTRPVVRDLTTEDSKVWVAGSSEPLGFASGRDFEDFREGRPAKVNGLVFHDFMNKKDVTYDGFIVYDAARGGVRQFSPATSKSLEKARELADANRKGLKTKIFGI